MTKNFFSGRAKFPRYRKSGSGDTFRFPGRDISTKRLNKKWSAVRLPKIGWVKYRDSRSIQGSVKSVTVCADALGWNISFSCEMDHAVPAPRADIVGIDRGISVTMALSTGELLVMPETLKRIEAQKRRAQRTVARRKRGSGRRRRAQIQVAKLQAKQARIRRDFQHRATLGVAKRFGVAVLEDLNIRAMTASARGTVTSPGVKVRQKAGLNREIRNAGWHQLAVILTYKMEERGGQVVTVPARFTSQTCAVCSVVDAQSRESQASFRCVSCGHSDHADTNAAINIKRRWSTPLLDVEGRGCAPVEASTRQGSLALENPCRLRRGGC